MLDHVFDIYFAAEERLRNNFLTAVINYCDKKTLAEFFKKNIDDRQKVYILLQCIVNEKIKVNDEFIELYVQIFSEHIWFSLPYFVHDHVVIFREKFHLIIGAMKFYNRTCGSGTGIRMCSYFPDEISKCFNQKDVNRFLRSLHRITVEDYKSDDDDTIDVKMNPLTVLRCVTEFRESGFIINEKIVFSFTDHYCGLH